MNSPDNQPSNQTDSDAIGSNRQAARRGGPPRKYDNKYEKQKVWKKKVKFEQREKRKEYKRRWIAERRALEKQEES